MSFYLLDLTFRVAYSDNPHSLQPFLTKISHASNIYLTSGSTKAEVSLLRIASKEAILVDSRLQKHGRIKMMSSFHVKQQTLPLII